MQLVFQYRELSHKIHVLHTLQTKPGGRSSQLRLAEGQDEENGETVDDSDADIDVSLYMVG